MVMSIPLSSLRSALSCGLSTIVLSRLPLTRALGGAILCLVVALLFRSAPYPYWHWQGGHISILKLLDGIRGGHAEKYALSVANCPGLFRFFWIQVATEFPFFL